jgi:ADP-heptose:LPS heptosyltransferase
MAVAVGTHVVALFGAADPARTGPYLQPEAVLYEPAPCSPCRKRDCFVEGHPCMSQLEVAAVEARIAELLGRGSPPAS